MKVKTYRAPSMKQALEEIKKELGPDAFILNGKEVKSKKVLGVFGRSHFEVTAAIDCTQPKGVEPREIGIELEAVKDSVQLSPAATYKADRRNSQLHSSAPKQHRSLDFPSGDESLLLLEEIRAMKSMIQSLPMGSVPSPFFVSLKPREFSHPVYGEVYSDLINRGIEENLAYELIDGAGKKGHKTVPPNKASLNKKIENQLSRLIKVDTDPIGRSSAKKPQILALLGPTGVGKTTTLAKLAARAVLEDRLEVGLITIDTFRIAAVEQLKTYAEIIGVPTKVVENVNQLDMAIKGFAGKDLVLIDTAGRSQRELDRQRDLANFFSQSTSIKKALLLSATTKQSDLVDMIDKYQMFGPSSLIFTKLDETQIYGPVINQLVRTAFPLAYVTVGQNVPKDILKPNPASLVNLALTAGQMGWESFACTASGVNPM